MQISRLSRFLVLSLAVLALLPVGALAAPLLTETVTIQVNLTMPNGPKVIGTIVARRTLTNPGTTELTFNGMINGTPARGSATATERWLGNGSEDVAITAISDWHAVLDAPPPMNLHAAQQGPGLLVVNGLPVGMDGLLEAPGSGRSSYTFVFPAQGSQDVVTLPNTGAGPGTDVTLVALPGTADGVGALFIVALLVGVSVLTLCARLAWRRQRA